MFAGILKLLEDLAMLTPSVRADRRLEALSPAQRHLLRMGPRNVRMIQGELRTLAAALGVPAGEPH